MNLTLRDAIARALEASEEMRISQEEVKIAQWQKREAGSKLLPQVDFLGSYLYTSEVMSLVQPPQHIAIPGLFDTTFAGRTTSFGDNHSVDFKLQVTQPLFAGNRLSRAFQALGYVVRQKQTEAERVAWQVRLRTEEVYTQAQKAAALRQIARLQVEKLQRHLDDAERRVQTGVAPREFAARADFALAQVKLKRQEAERAFQLARLALFEAIDLPESDEEIEFDSLEFTAAEIREQDFEFAQTHRAEFKSLEAQAGFIAQRVEVEKGAYYPTFNVFGAVDYGRPGIDKVANDWMFYEIVGLNLSWTLWDWKGRSHRVEQIKANHRQLEASRRVLESRVKLEVRSAQLSAESARQQVAVAQAGQKLAQEVADWVQGRYDEGLAQEQEFLDAQDDLTASQSEYVIALADYRLANLALNAARGSERNP